MSSSLVCSYVNKSEANSHYSHLDLFRLETQWPVNRVEPYLFGQHWTILLLLFINIIFLGSSSVWILYKKKDLDELETKRKELDAFEKRLQEEQGKFNDSIQDSKNEATKASQEKSLAMVVKATPTQNKVTSWPKVNKPNPYMAIAKKQAKKKAREQQGEILAITKPRLKAAPAKPAIIAKCMESAKEKAREQQGKDLAITQPHLKAALSSQATSAKPTMEKPQTDVKVVSVADSLQHSENKCFLEGSPVRMHKEQQFETVSVVTPCEKFRKRKSDDEMFETPPEKKARVSHLCAWLESFPIGGMFKIRKHVAKGLAQD